MFLGDKLWEGKGKTLSMTVKEANSNGGTLEFSWVAKLTGFGKAAGLNVALTFTASKNADFVGAGPTAGQGVFFSKEGNMVSVRGTGYGRPRQGHGRAIEIWTFRADAQSLKWLNDIIALVSINGDDSWKEFTIEINEWDPIELR